MLQFRTNHEICSCSRRLPVCENAHRQSATTRGCHDHPLPRYTWVFMHAISTDKGSSAAQVALYKGSHWVVADWLDFQHVDTAGGNVPCAPHPPCLPLPEHTIVRNPYKGCGEDLVVIAIISSLLCNGFSAWDRCVPSFLHVRPEAAILPSCMWQNLLVECQ